MRILKLGVYTPAYLDQFYRAHPGLDREDYATQHAALLDDAFGSADFWTAALRNRGHVTTDLVINAEPLQRAWAGEHHLPWPGGEWVLATGLEQVKAFRPDILLVADYSTVTYAFLRQVQSECPSIRLTLIWCGAPYRNGEVFRACDVVLSCVPELVDDFRAQGLRAEHLNHAFEPRVLEHLPAITSPSVDFSFLGSVILAGSFHRERARILDALVRETTLRIWSDVSLPSLRSRAGQQARILAFDAMATARRLGIPQQALAPLPLIGRAARWPGRPGSIETAGPRIVRRARKPLYGLAMFGKLRDSRVTLNTHIEISRCSASNMRMFEATGVGTCLLTDRKERLPDLFEPDTEVVTYASAAECVEKVRYLLAHESERAAIAAAGQRRTLRDHTFTHRAAQLEAILEDALSAAGKT
jgi:spore maturation protein CgeB